MSPSTPRRVLIAGGAGFIGSHLSERYLEAGWDVHCLDNLYTGSEKNIEHLFEQPNFRFIRHDVIVPYTDAAKFDLILNFACPASPVHYQRDPIATMKTGVIGTLNLLELAKKTGARFFQASTSEVYGDPVQHPQTESYWGNVNPIGVRSCYDEAKRAGETLCFDFHRFHGVDIRVIRIFNTYGPRMDPADGRVVSNFIVQALKGEDLTIYGEGEQTRSFCYVDDLVAGIMRYADLPENIPGPINLGNDGEFTVRQLADEVLKQTGSRSKIVHLGLPLDDPKCRRPNLSKAKEILGWTPKIPLQDGVGKTIAYFRSLLDIR